AADRQARGRRQAREELGRALVEQRQLLGRLAEQAAEQLDRARLIDLAGREIVGVVAPQVLIDAAERDAVLEALLMQRDPGRDHGLQRLVEAGRRVSRDAGE